MPEEDVPAVGAAPTEEIAFLSRLPPKTAPQDAVFQTKLARKGRENRGVAKRIGRVQHVEASAKAFRIGGAEQKIADERLRRRDQLIKHRDEPGLEGRAREVPLPVPVSMGDEVQDQASNARLR